MPPLTGATLQAGLESAIRGVIVKNSITQAVSAGDLAAQRNTLPTELATAIATAVVTYLNTLKIPPGVIKTVGGPASQLNILVPPTTIFLE